MALNIIFMGTPEFAVPILKSIHESQHKVLEVYTQSPKKKDRGQKINLSPIHKYSNKINIKVSHPENLNSEDAFKYLKKLKPDVVVVVAYGKILPSKILHLPGTIFLNIHASLLPKLRGAAPIQRSIMNMDKETGISIMKIVEKLDAGPVMKYAKIDINNDSTFESLSRDMSYLSSKLILESLDIVEKKEEKFLEQDHSRATYAKKIEKIESKIIWNDQAKKIIAKINALHPSPGTWFEFNGSRIKILKAIEVRKKGKPGEIIDKNFTIGCKENSIQILELKKEGKNNMKTSEFIKGNNLEIGKILYEK
jgi:methionyl-tRNA formyltransferase